MPPMPAPTSCSSRSAAPPGLRAADDALAGALRRAGASVARRARARGARELRTFALTDLAWALPARRAARARRSRDARAARDRLLDDAPRRCCGRSRARSASTRPRPATGPAATGSGSARSSAAASPPRRCCCRWSEGALAEAPAPHAPGARRAGAVAPSRAAGADARPRGDHLRRQPAQEGPRPRARRLARGAARRARRSSSPGVAGADEDGVRYAGMIAPAEYRALLRRARVFVTAPRREDYGIAQLEALADGCAARHDRARRARTRRCRSPARSIRGSSATTSPRRIRAALDDPAPGYAERARAALAPWTPAAVDALVRRAPAPGAAG